MEVHGRLSNKYSIAVIENNPADVMLLRLALAQAGFEYESSEIRDGKFAFKSLLHTTTPPDLVITDANLPGISLEEILTRIKQSESLKHVPVIVVSGMQDPWLIEHALKWGASDYVVKPFNVDGWLRLAEHLKKIVEDYRQGGKASSA